MYLTKHVSFEHGCVFPKAGLGLSDSTHQRLEEKSEEAVQRVNAIRVLPYTFSLLLEEKRSIGYCT